MKKLLLALVAVFALGLQVANAQTGYGIRINNVEITSANAANFTASGLTGSVNYNASTHVLTLNNVSAASLNFVSSPDVTVNFSGNCQFSQMVYNASEQKVIFHGQTATSQLTAAMIGAEEAGSDFEFADGIFRINEDMSAAYGLYGYGDENLTFTNAEAYIGGGSSCAVDSWNSITFNGCAIVTPVGATVQNGCIRLNGNEISNQIVHIARVTTNYGIFINNTEITSANASNFTTSGLTGTVTYDANTHMLTLDNVSAVLLVFNGISADVTVTFSGNNQFSNVISNISAHKVTLQGQTATAQLTSARMGAENAGSDIELANGIFRVNENMSQRYGLSGYGAENLTFTNAEAYIGGGSGCAIDEWNSIAFNGCAIVTPVGATVQNGCVKLNGAEISNQVVHIAPITMEHYGIKINDVEITTANATNFTAPNLTGTVTYDANTHVLTLNNVIANLLTFSRLSADVTVTFNGNNQFSNLISNTSAHKVTLQGQTSTAQLTADRIFANSLGSDFELSNGIFRINENMSQNYGLYGFNMENLTFTNAEAYVGGGSDCAIDDWNSITLNGCEIVAPVGAVVENGCVKLNGNEIANQIVHIAPVVAIDIVRTTEFAIVPNPAKDETVLMLEPYTGTATMQIVDVNGRILTTVLLPAQQENYRLDVSTLAAGTYFINVTANGTRQTATLLKK